jgi:hypothetical protein
MNMNLNLDFDIKKLLPMLRRLQPYIFGGALIAVFAYTALVVNAALNVEPDATAVTAADPTAKINFDKTTIETVKTLQVVQGEVPAGDLGKTDPFR